MRRLAAALMCALVLTTAGCNTVKGMGKDIQSVGEAGQKAM